MNSYCFVLKFKTPLGTPLKGDTLFGHICWQIAYDKGLFNRSIEELLSNYEQSPFCVVSSGFPVIKHNDRYFFLFPKPSLPLEMLFADQLSDDDDFIKNRKIYKKKKWMILDNSKGNLKNAGYFTDKEVLNEFFGSDIDGLIKDFSYVHNALQRTSFSTSSEGFAPFSVYNSCFHPDLYTGIVVCSYEENLKALQKTFERIGKIGFGRDASTGLGKFELVDSVLFDIKNFGAENPQALYTLSPSFVNPDEFKECYFIPFIRYGKHGDILAKARNPFKNPVVMLDEGAILIPKSKEKFQLPYVGKALRGISLSFDKTVHQGYSPYIPVSLEGNDD